jgi:hypothetical protein
MSGFSKFIVGIDGLLLADLSEACEVSHVLSGLQIPLDIITRLKERGASSETRFTLAYTRDDFLPRKVAEAERYLKC